MIVTIIRCRFTRIAPSSESPEGRSNAERTSRGRLCGRSSGRALWDTSVSPDIH